MINKAPGKWINRIGFRRLLILTFSIGIILMVLASTLVTSYLSGKPVEKRLIQDGMNLATLFSEQSRVPLLYRSESDAELVSQALLSFPDVKAVGIFDSQHKPLYSSFDAQDKDRLQSQSLPGQPEHLLETDGTWYFWDRNKPWSDQPVLELETQSAWYFVALVYTGTQADNGSAFLTEAVAPELVGYVRVQVGKQSLRRMQADIFRYNLLVSIVLAVGLLLILRAIAGQITKPINRLAEAMERARGGEKEIRAQIEGTREIIKMERAFNAMMDVLDARENDLLVARDIALEAARVKGEFAANVSHELRTPLNGVLGMLELLGEMGLASKQKEYVEIASGSAEALLLLIDDILDFSKMDSGKMQLVTEEFGLSGMLEELVFMLGLQAQKKDIDLAYIIDPDIPSLLTGDSGRIRQILINLLGNALKFTLQGEVGVEVSIVSRSAETIELRFEVTDTGIGMTDEAQARIFEAFSQADGSTTRKYGGTGLGLAISRQLVHLLDGTIGVESVLGQGSIFWFTVKFPAVETVLPDPIVMQDIKVLVVDDSHLNQRYIEHLLQTMQLSCEVVATGADALAKLRRASAQGVPFDVALIDEVMPGMKGTDLAHFIVSDPAIISTRVIMMVNRANPTFDNTRKLNLAGVLAKPVKRNELATLIDVIPIRIIKRQQQPITELPQDTGIAFFGGKKILVVEDNRANQQVAIGMLERLGCRASLANTGREALTLITRESFDLVLMDCHMPEVDGYEATAQIRQMEASDQRLLIVAMTANVQRDESEKCLAVGMDDYLPKPLKLETLRNKLKKWLPVTEYRVGGNDGGAQGTELAQTNMIDREIYNALRNDIGSAFSTLVQGFLDDLPDYIRSLKDAVSVRDCHAFADVAHSIRGSAGNFGARRLVGYCQQLETLGREQQIEGADRLLGTIVDECGLLYQFFEQHTRGEAIEADEPETNEASAEIVDHEHADVARQRVLIVDDDRGMRFAMRKVLEDEGCRVDEVSSGEQALMYCERFLPDLVLMDAIMPGIDGFEACMQIQTIPGGRNMPVLMITSLNDEMSIGRAFASGATDYIPKPVNFAVLRKRILRLLQAATAEKHVRKLAYNDTLTGLPNRALFTEKLSEVIADHTQDAMTALLFLDLDRFKLVNDALGHDAGDLLLRVVAERLQGCVRQNDFVSRFGGDEFTIILHRVKSYKVVESIAEKIHQTLSRPFVFLGKEMHVSASIGISLYPYDGKDIGTLLKNADIAMYRAKDRGDHFAFYEEKMEADVARRLGLENDLRGATQRNEMELYYQPQEDLATGEIIGMEALIRWNHPNRGLVNPMEFIPLAEETGQILELGDWVMETACRQAKTWLDQGSRMRVAVNIAARQLDNGDLAERTAAVLERTGLPPQYLELEITESTIMMNAEAVIGTLEELKRMGIKLAIDDFGTGYSSLSYLKRFPIDLLKIDRAFVSDITTDKADADIVTTIINLAHNLGVKVIAEGVEEEVQKAYLQSKGCDFIQGYLLGKPVPAQEFEKTFLARLDSKQDSERYVNGPV